MVLLIVFILIVLASVYFYFKAKNVVSVIDRMKQVGNCVDLNGTVIDHGYDVFKVIGGKLFLLNFGDKDEEGKDVVFITVPLEETLTYLKVEGTPHYPSGPVPTGGDAKIFEFTSTPEGLQMKTDEGVFNVIRCVKE